MNQLTRIILWVFTLFFGGFFIWLWFFNKETKITISQNCEEDLYIRRTDFSGVITKKFIDSANHNLRTLYILDKGIKYDFKIVYDEDSILWVKTSIGDSLKKKLKDNKFVLISKKKIDTLIVDYPCKD